MIDLNNTKNIPNINIMYRSGSIRCHITEIRAVVMPTFDLKGMVYTLQGIATPIDLKLMSPFIVSISRLLEDWMPVEEFAESVPVDGDGKAILDPAILNGPAEKKVEELARNWKALYPDITARSEAASQASIQFGRDRMEQRAPGSPL